jgi:uncharacterized membrane protein
MDAYLIEWLGAFLRVVHVISAIAWIGASFYFVWLDNSLEPQRAKSARPGVAGELWAMHGGGLYEVARYGLRPGEMPGKLHFFKWQAYATWLTGVALLVVTYYLHADTYLVGPKSGPHASGVAIGASVAFLLGGWGVYEALVRTPLARHGAAFALVMLGMVSGMSWLAFELFTPRAASVHTGALLATIMAGNVFVGIIPAQKAFLRDVEGGVEPDTERAGFAKLRSMHNNYLALPVVICMLSNHALFLHASESGWLLLVVVCGLSAIARHFFNLRSRGQTRPALLWGPLVALLAIAVGLATCRGPG